MEVMKVASQHQISVYFDGLCPLCSKEMDMYRAKKGSELIRFVDIAHPEFDARAEGLDPDGIHKRFHVKTKEGKIFEGVDAFQQIWIVLGIFRPLMLLTSNAITRPLFDIGYTIFAKIRPLLRKNECDSDYCEMDMTKGANS